MPNLFPESDAENENIESTETAMDDASPKKSWRFDFAKGEFVTTPTGKVEETDGIETWVQWCQKALLTDRYRYLVYPRDYGQEFDSLISRHLTEAGDMSEIERITRECLMVHPQTKSVDNFTFNMEGDTMYFTCEITNIYDETRMVNNKVVI